MRVVVAILSSAAVVVGFASVMALLLVGPVWLLSWVWLQFNHLTAGYVRGQSFRSIMKDGRIDLFVLWAAMNRKKVGRWLLWALSGLLLSLVVAGLVALLE